MTEFCSHQNTRAFVILNPGKRGQREILSLSPPVTVTIEESCVLNGQEFDCSDIRSEELPVDHNSSILVGDIYLFGSASYRVRGSNRAISNTDSFTTRFDSPSEASAYQCPSFRYSNVEIQHNNPRLRFVPRGSRSLVSYPVKMVPLSVLQRTRRSLWGIGLFHHSGGRLRRRIEYSSSRSYSVKCIYNQRVVRYFTSDDLLSRRYFLPRRLYFDGVEQLLDLKPVAGEEVINLNPERFLSLPGYFGFHGRTGSIRRIIHVPWYFAQGRPGVSYAHSRIDNLEGSEPIITKEPLPRNRKLVVSDQTGVLAEIDDFSGDYCVQCELRTCKDNAYPIICEPGKICCYGEDGTLVDRFLVRQ